MLVSLLKPQSPAKPAVKTNNAFSQPVVSVLPSAELIRAVTTALGANGTELAREALAQLLGGEISPGDALPPAQRQAAVEGSLGALLREGTLEGEQLVLRVSLCALACGPGRSRQAGSRRAAAG